MARRVEFGEVKDKLWQYFPEGEEQPVNVTVEKVDHKWVYLSIGERILREQFLEVCESLIDESSEIQEQFHQQPAQPKEVELNINDIDTGGASPDLLKELMGNVEFDENGIPKTVKNPDQVQQKILSNTAATPKATRPGAIKQQPTIQSESGGSPLVALIEKGKLKTKQLFIPLDIPLVDKTLFNVLIESYPDEEIDILLDHLVNKVGTANIIKAIKSKILQNYGIVKQQPTQVNEPEHQ